jgi:hypothetical protein
MKRRSFVIFNTHSQLLGTHAFLSASNYHWINYDDDKLERMWTAAQAAQRGTDLHALAHDLIRLGVRLPTRKTTLNEYVNDAIGYRMVPEQKLFYSLNCYGTADCIGFRRNTLRIHDLKTGVTPASMQQLLVYAALFCLEYRHRPFEIEMDLRIYQNDVVEKWEPDPDAIFHVMDRIVTFDKRINEMRMEAYK